MDARKLYFQNLERVCEELFKEEFQRNLDYRINILIYELGEFVKAVSYALYYEGTVYSKGYHGEVKIALSDLYTQIHVLMLYFNVGAGECGEVPADIQTSLGGLSERRLLNVLSLDVLKLLEFVFSEFGNEQPTLRGGNSKAELLGVLTKVYGDVKTLIVKLGFSEEEIANFGLIRLEDAVRTKIGKGKK
jgi:hypothetical protein